MKRAVLLAAIAAIAFCAAFTWFMVATGGFPVDNINRWWK